MPIDMRPLEGQDFAQPESCFDSELNEVTEPDRTGREQR